MMLDMISNDDHRHIDNALIHSNFSDISDDISRAATSFDMSNDISNGLNNIDPVRFEVPDTNFSVPDVHVPDVHVPDISIPDTTSFDSGGGFDAGGGFD